MLKTWKCQVVNFVEEQEPMMDGEQRDGSMAEHAAHSKRDLERAKEALMRLHVNLGRPGVKELIRVLKHGRASELASQEARRMSCDVCAETVQPKLPRPEVPRQVLDFNERLELDIVSLLHWEGFTKSVKCLNIVCHGAVFQMIIPLWSETTALDLRQAYREGWQRWARDPKKVVLDPAGGHLHGIFLVPDANVAAVTMPVLDRSSERATQIRQAARQAFAESQDDKAMRRALVARPRPWREFQVGDQVAFWQKGEGHGMKHDHARWHGRAVILALCLGSENVWVACRHHLLKVSQEQLRMAKITEGVADDVIHQKLRAVAEDSAAERQERFRSRSSGHVQQENTAQPHNPDSGSPSDGISPDAEGSETEKSETTRRRSAGKRAAENDMSVSSKRERRKRTDLSFVSPSPETTFLGTDLELRLRGTGGRARTSTGFTDGRSGVLFTAGPKVCKPAESGITSLVIQREEARTVKDFSLADKLSKVPWSAPSGEKRNLEVDEERQSKKQYVSERESPMLEENDEILWCAMLDTEWKNLGEGAVRILSGDSAEKAKNQFGDRFIPSRYVVNCPNLGEFKARWCLRGYLDPYVMELVDSGSIQSPTVSQLGRVLSCQMIVCNGWNIHLGDIRSAFLKADYRDRKQEPLYSRLPPGGIRGVSDDAVILILGNIYGLNDAPQRWWKKFDAVMSSIGFSRSTSDVCVYTPRALPETWREFCASTWTTHFVVDRVPCSSKLCESCDIVFHFVSGKLEKKVNKICGMAWDSIFVDGVRTPVECLMDVGATAVFALYLGKQVDGELTIGGVNGAHYTGMSRTVLSSLDTKAPLVGKVCLPWQTVDGRQGELSGCRDAACPGDT